MITIICVLRKGSKIGYNATWVEKLYNGVKRNLTMPFKFICFSDCEVPCDRIPLDAQGEGYWSKLQIFKEGAVTGPVLFLDLDTVICGNIDQLVQSLVAQDKFIMWRDDHYNISASCILYWNGNYSHIYNSYIKDPEYYENRFSAKNQGPERLLGDQAVISTLQPHNFINDLCPEDWIRVVTKQDHRVDFSNCKILVFRKAHTKPSNQLNHPLVKEHWI